MGSWEGYLDDLARVPAARQPATLGEIWNSEWQRGGLDTITGIGKPLADARNDLATGIENAAGKPLAEFAADHRILLGAGVTTDQHIAALNALADRLPAEQQEKLKDLRDVRRRAAANAQKIEKDAADVSSATYGASGTATAWAASIARQTADPVNLGVMAATAPIGGPVTGRALQVVGRQALAGALGQAAVEPYIEPARAELGLEAGVGRAATNIFEAGVGGAAIAGAGLGVAKLFRVAADSFRGRPEAPALPAEGAPAIADPFSDPAPVAPSRPNIAAEDFDAMHLHAERDAAIHDQAQGDPVAHAQSVRDAGLALEEGRPMPAIDRVEEPPVAPAPPERQPAPVAAEPQPELPLRQPIEPGPPVKEPAEVIGDPALARELDTRLAALPDGEGTTFHVEQADKTLKSGTAKSFLKEIADDAKAVSELIDCIGKEPT